MATPEYRNRISSFASFPPGALQGSADQYARAASARERFWIALDLLTILGAAILATLFKAQTGPVAGMKGFWHGTLIHGRSMGILLVLLSGFAVALVIASRRLRLYTPKRMTGLLHEQRLSVEACIVSGLLLTGTLYLIRAEDIPRSIVLITIGLVTVSLSLRRLAYRILIYRQFQRGVGTRNVLIVGTGPEAHALRHHLESLRHLGYTFKGFVDFPGAGSRFPATSGDVVGSLDTMFQAARKLFVDEIFFTTPCERAIVQDVLDQARTHSVDLRVVPDMYDGVSWNSPIEYIGQFPTIPLHSGHVPEIGLLFKRVMDMIFCLADADRAFAACCWPSPSPSSSIRRARSSTSPSASARRAASSAASSSAPWCGTRTSDAPT